MELDSSDGASAASFVNNEQQPQVSDGSAANDLDAPYGRDRTGRKLVLDDHVNVRNATWAAHSGHQARVKGTAKDGMICVTYNDDRTTEYVDRKQVQFMWNLPRQLEPEGRSAAQPVVQSASVAAPAVASAALAAVALPVPPAPSTGLLSPPHPRTSDAAVAQHSGAQRPRSSDSPSSLVRPAPSSTLGLAGAATVSSIDQLLSSGALVAGKAKGGNKSEASGAVKLKTKKKAKPALASSSSSSAAPPSLPPTPIIPRPPAPRLGGQPPQSSSSSSGGGNLPTASMDVGAFEEDDAGASFSSSQQLAGGMRTLSIAQGEDGASGSAALAPDPTCASSASSSVAAMGQLASLQEDGKNSEGGPSLSEAEADDDARRSAWASSSSSSSGKQGSTSNSVVAPAAPATAASLALPLPPASSAGLPSPPPGLRAASGSVGAQHSGVKRPRSSDEKSSKSASGKDSGSEEELKEAAAVAGAQEEEAQPSPAKKPRTVGFDGNAGLPPAFLALSRSKMELRLAASRRHREYLAARGKRDHESASLQALQGKLDAARKMLARLQAEEERLTSGHAFAQQRVAMGQRILDEAQALLDKERQDAGLSADDPSLAPIEDDAKTARAELVFLKQEEEKAKAAVEELKSEMASTQADIERLSSSVATQSTKLEGDEAALAEAAANLATAKAALDAAMKEGGRPEGDGGAGGGGAGGAGERGEQ